MTMLLLLLLLLISVGFNVVLLIQSKKLLKIKKDKESGQEDLKKCQDDLKKCQEESGKLLVILKEINTSIPKFGGNEKFNDEVELLQMFLSGSYGGKKAFWSDESNKFFKELRKRLEAWDLVMELQEKVTTPFYRMLNDQQNDVLLIREQFIKMSMQLFDAVSEFKSPNRRLEQELNINVFKGSMTEDEAFNEAKIITNLEVETPLWVRNWVNGLQNIGMEDRNIIVSGYKFPYEN